MSATSGRILDLAATLRSATIGGGLSAASEGRIELTSDGNLTLDDRFLTSPIELSETGTTGLVGFSAASIIGAINELRRLGTRTVSAASDTTLATDDVVLIDYSSTGVCIVTISSALIATDGFTVTYVDSGGNSSENNIQFETEGSETINGEPSAVINGDGSSMTFKADSSNLFII